jgi:hypothetical protein
MVKIYQASQDFVRVIACGYNNKFDHLLKCCQRILSKVRFGCLPTDVAAEVLVKDDLFRYYLERMEVTIKIWSRICGRRRNLR